MAPAGVSLLKRVEKWDIKAVLLGGVVVVSSKHMEELCVLHRISSKATPPLPPRRVSALTR